MYTDVRVTADNSFRKTNDQKKNYDLNLIDILGHDNEDDIIL